MTTIVLTMTNTEIAPSQWDSLVNKTFQKKEDILPLQNAEVVNLKTDLDAFFLQIREFRGTFRKNAPFEAVDMTSDQVRETIIIVLLYPLCTTFTHPLYTFTAVRTPYIYTRYTCIHHKYTL